MQVVDRYIHVVHDTGCSANTGIQVYMYMLYMIQVVVQIQVYKYVYVQVGEVRSHTN